MPELRRAFPFWPLRGVGAALLILAASHASATPVDKAISICDLAAAAKDLDGTSVRVKAVFETDQLEFSGLSDSRCPGVHMSLEFAVDSAHRHRSITNFERAVFGDIGDLRLRRLEVEFSGTFHWDAMPGERPQHNGLDEPRGAISMTRVWTYARWRS